MDQLTNKPIDQLSIGQTAYYKKTCSHDDIALFAAASGDINPIHLDQAYAKTTEFGQVIAHGMYTGALVSAAIALKLPGPGSIYRGQSIKFKAPVFAGDTLTVILEITHIKKAIVTLDCQVKNQNDQIVAIGEATVIAPKSPLSIDINIKPEFKAV